MHVCISRARLSSLASVLALVFLLTPTLAPAPGAAAEPAACSPATRLTAGESWRSSGGDHFHDLAITVPEPGWLALRARGSGEDARPAWIDYSLAACDADALRPAGPAATLGYALVRVAEAGTLRLRLGALDAERGRWEGVRLSTHLFSAVALSPYGKDGAPGDGTEVEDPEILPSTHPGGECFRTVYGLPVDGRRSLIGQDGAPGDGTEVEDPEILPTLPAVAALACTRGEPLDDFPVCAADLGGGGAIEGSFEDAGVGLDEDHYSFRVDGLHRVSIRVESALPLALALLDAAGRELARQPLDGGGGSHEAILTPGRYLLRLTAPADPGAHYRLHLEQGGLGR